MPLLLAIVASFLIGSIPTGFLLGKVRGIDIRKYGSGNVGATNVYRALGKLPGLFVLAVDILKGIVALTLLPKLFFPLGVMLNYEIFRYVLGLSVVAGHNWNIFLKFKGGRGVATSLGVLAVLWWPQGMVIAVSTWLITVCITRYVSVGSMLAALSIPVAAAILGKPNEFVIFAAILALVVVWRHEANIRRLIKGEEHKVFVKR